MPGRCGPGLLPGPARGGGDCGSAQRCGRSDPTLDEKGLDPPTQLMGSTADGLISATGTAVEQQMDGPAATALQESGGDALLGPGEITATGGNDDDRAMNNNRRRQQASQRQCSSLSHCRRGQAHGLQSKRTGQVVRGLLIQEGAAGDGLVALGAVFILAVQTHCGEARMRVGQWIRATLSHAHPPRPTDNQCSQIRSKSTDTRAVARGHLGPHPNTGPGAEGGGVCSGHRASQLST